MLARPRLYVTLYARGLSYLWQKHVPKTVSCIIFSSATKLDSF